MTLRGGDAINVDNLPKGLDVYWGYRDGRWPDFPAIKAEFRATVFSIATRSVDDADFLDVETGDATDQDAPGWWARQRARGVARPGLYRQTSGVASLMVVLAAAKIPRAYYRLWTAHYDPQLGAHICSPACGFGMPTTADATQWVDHDNLWDESLCDPSILEETEKMSQLARPLCEIVNRPQGDGYWLVFQDGGVEAFGKAPAIGSEAAVNLQPGHLVISAASTPSGAGLYLAGSDGGVFTLGDAKFLGSTGQLGIAPSSQPLES